MIQATLELYQTQQRAFQSLSEGLKSHTRHIVWRALRWHSMTRREVAEVTGVCLSSVCARVVELSDMGGVEVVGLKQDPETGINVQLLRGIYTSKEVRKLA